LPSALVPAVTATSNSLSCAKAISPLPSKSFWKPLVAACASPSIQICGRS
jgi:hypothetical protein